MEAALIARLLADAGLKVLVGSRVHWLRRPQGSNLPAIVLHRIDGSPDYHMGGPSGLSTSRVQADCWAKSYGEAKGIARALEAAISGARFTADTARIDGVFIADERDTTEDDGDAAVFRTSLDLMVHHAAT